MGIHKWGPECDDSFFDLRNALVSAPILVPTNWNLPFRCHLDASQNAVGGTLTQIDG